MTTFITRFDTSGPGLRLAVKDLIDMAGVPTTAGCRAVADEARPAPADAICLAGARAARARIVGRANLHELALGVTGENPWFGTPVNPLDPRLVPGGSSSGSAVAVATGEADVAYGTDTGGSVRIPSACCGTAGLKTTHGRIALEGVWPLAPSFDTVGPMAADVAGLVAGMCLLEPGFAPAPKSSWRVGRLRPEADPSIDAAVDEALRLAEFEVVELVVPEWAQVTAEAGLLLVAEAWSSDGPLVERAESRIGPDVVARLRIGRDVEPATLQAAWSAARRWRERLVGIFRQVDMLATPTLTIYPPPLGHGEDLLMARCTLPANLAGIPAISLAVPSSAELPASLQLMGPHGSEETLVAGAAVVEAAVAR
ncbi:MAG TPA: amidase [Acidimicrobiales bacterium]|nr:amidase [Acidimicrobiales bacterium]